MAECFYLGSGRLAFQRLRQYYWVISETKHAQYSTTFHRWINNNVIIVTSCLPCHLLAWYSGYETVVLLQCLLPNIDNKSQVAGCKQFKM